MLVRLLCRWLLPGSLAFATFGQSVPKLNSISREWIRRGAKTEIRLSGENLATATNVMVSGGMSVWASLVPAAGVKVPVESSAGGISSVTRPDGKSLQVILNAEADAALTERELRVVSSDGVSNPVTFRLSPWPEADAANNLSRESAQKLEMPVAVNGTIGAAAESHFFRISGKKGERVIADVYAFRLGSRLDSSLAVYDSSGKELARNEDAVGLDSVLDFTLPADSDYVLELRDFRYQGGSDYKYRMIVGVLPHVVRAFPFGGTRGTTVDVTLDGANLDSEKLSLNLAAEAALGRQEIRAASSRGLSNPFSFEVSDLPQVMESEPNSALDQADSINIPVAVNGRIAKKKDYDAFRFHVQANQRVVFDVMAARMGSRLDAMLTLADRSGKELARNDDAAGEDARIDYTFKEAGEYFIILEDLLGRGGDDFGYRMAVEVPAPDFSVTVVRDTLRVRQSGRTPVRCEVNRVNGFDETVTIQCENLPPGVYAEPLMIPASANAGFLVVSATGDARLGSFPLKTAGRASLGGKIITRSAEALSGDRTAQESFLTVLGPAPFAIAPATLMAAVEQNQTGSIEVLVERRAGFSGEIKIAPEGFSAGRDPITRSFDVQTLVLKASETRGVLNLKTRLDSEIGVRQVVLRGETDGGVTDYSPLIPVGTQQIPFVLSTSLKKLAVTAVAANSGSSAAEAVFSARAERRGGFEGEIELKLEGVPSGVSATVTNIAAKAGESALRLIASEQAPIATNVTLTLTGVGHHNDRTYRFQAPPITLTINAAEAEEKKEPKLVHKQ